VEYVPDGGLGLPGAAAARGGAGDRGGVPAQWFAGIAGEPVEGVFQPAGDAEVVFGGEDQQRVRGEDGIGELADRAGLALGFEVLAEDRNTVQARQVQPKAGRGGIAGGAGEGPVDRGGPQAAGWGEEVGRRGPPFRAGPVAGARRARASRDTQLNRTRAAPEIAKPAVRPAAPMTRAASGGLSVTAAAIPACHRAMAFPRCRTPR